MSNDEWISLDMGQAIWDKFYTVAPLYVVGTYGEDGEPDLAPKHLAFPVGWSHYFGFVCAPDHATYRNIVRDECFSVSAPRPDQVVLAGLAASPRCEDGSKPVVYSLPSFPAKVIDAPVMQDTAFWLECRLDRVVEDLGPNLLILGKVVAARIHRDMVRMHDGDPEEQLYRHPLLAFVSPDRFAAVKTTQAFPFPRGFQR